MEQLQQLKRCPVGIQTFSNIIEDGYLYIDKTEYVYRLAHSDAKYYFLSRPRRFGKSLLTSTLRSYFEGRKDLFEGLAIEELETEWTEYPVLHFDMSLAKHLEKEGLERYLGNRLAVYEEQYGITKPAVDNNDRLTNLIMRANKQTGRKVVVLIDEYDAPLLDVMHEDRDLPILRNVMRNFYSPLKGCDPYLRFVFLTGITKFSQLSIFSELNNISNISMDEPYAAICGITEEEMLGQMGAHIARLALNLELTYDETVQKLKDKYDGYHFTWPSPDIYNPFSLMNALARNNIDNYWFGSGTPTYLIEMLRKYNVIPQTIGQRKVLASAFDAPTECLTDITPLLYQSGYITIKDKNKAVGLYTLDIPNGEIRIGLMESLLPNYLASHTEEGKAIVAQMYLCILQDDLEGALCLLRDFLLTVPYCDHTDYEGHYQQLFYVIFSLFGMYVDVEVRTPRGRVDMVMRTATKLYLVELKVDRPAAMAMEQIRLRDYPSRFALSGLPVVKVGISFDPEKKTIGEWVIE
ncbi:MAG: ATP-binding protein [Lachnospiraceae bacterium]|nr:ATP-binding protein [Lachnospiraceae bacterium]